jgi:thiol reductant ABC exporter CydD subunit
MRPLDPRLLRYASATRSFLALCVGLGVANAVLIVIQASLLAQGITCVFDGDTGPPEDTDSTVLTRTLLALTLVIVGRAMVAWAQEIAAQRTAAAVKTELRRGLFERLAKLGPAWLTRQRTGEIAALAGPGLEALDGYFARYLPQLVLAALIPAVVLARIFPRDGIAAGTILVTLPLIPLFMVLIGHKTQRAQQRQFRLLARLSHHFLDVVTGLPTLKAYRRARAQEATIRSVTSEYRRVTLRTLRVAFLSSLVLELVATLSVALVAVGIGLRLVDGQLDLRTALVVLILAPEAYLPLRQVGANFHASTEGLAAANQAFAILETPVPITGTSTLIPDLATSTLSLESVSVRYPDRDHPAISGFELTVRPCEIVALTGPSGCGKSTVLSALMGFVTPTSGRIMIGEVALADLDLDAWRERIAWVPQRPRLFAGTVADNVRLGAPQADDAMVSKAVRAAGAERFVAALPHGIHTRISERGRGLSAGERQRIALARAFLRDASLVLLDEPTANLDGVAEAEIITAVRRLAAGRTVIVAAHRPSLVAMADRTVPVDDPTSAVAS